MATTEAEIPAPVCETIKDQVGNIIVEQATTILMNKVPQEETNQADAPSEPPSVEGDSFLTPPSSDEVHCDVNNNPIDTSKFTGKTDEAVKNEPQKDDQTLEDAANEETSSKGIQQNCEETKVTEKTEESSLIQVDSSQTESDEQLETENEKLQLTEVSTPSAVIVKKIKDEDEDLRKVEFFENANAEKEEAQIDKPADSLHVVSEVQDSKTSCQEEKTIDVNQKVIEDEKTIDAVDTENSVIESFSTVVSSCQGEESANANLEAVAQKEVLEDVSAIVSNEEVDEEPKIKLDVSEIETAEHLQKESEKPSPLPLAEESSLDESIVTHEVQGEGDLTKAELCENAEIKEDVLPKIDSKVDKPDDILHKASEETSSLLLDRKTEDKTVNEAEIKDESSKKVASVVSNEKAENDSLIPVDCHEVKDVGCLDEVKIESENQRGTELFEEVINERTVLLNEEVQIEKTAEPCHAAVEEIKASENSHGDLGDKIEERTIDAAENNEKADELQDNNEPASSESTKTVEERSLIDSQATISTDRIDAIDTKEVTHEVQSGTTTTPHEYIQEDSVTQADCTQMEHLKRESENQISIEVQPEKNNDKEPENMHELKDRDVDLIKAELQENEESTGSGSVKEDAEMEKPTESLPVVTADMKAFDSGPCTEIIEEQIQTSDPQEISSDIIEEKTFDAASTKEETVEDIPTNPPGVLGEKTEKTIASAESNEKTDELQGTPENNKESASNEDIQTTCSPAKQSLMKDSQAIMSTKKIDVIDTKEVANEGQNVETTMPHEHTEGNSVAQADCTQMEHEYHLEKESEISSLEEAQSEENNSKESENMIELKDRDADLKKDELIENDKNTGIDLVKEEAQIEKPIDSLKVVTEDIKVCDSSKYTEIIGEQIQTLDPQEISSEKIEERTIDAVDTNENLEGIATNDPRGHHKDNQTVEVEGTEKPYPENASTRSVRDDDSTVTHEGELVDESSTKADLSENEKTTEEILVKEQASTESLQIATEDITEFASVQARETTPLVEKNPTAIPQGNEGDQREDRTNDETGVKEETPGDKDVTTTVPSEATQERSLDQGDCSEMKQNEQLEKESDNSPMIETPKEEIEESTLVMEVGCDEELAGSTEATNSVEELITSRDIEEISGENTEEKPIDAAETNKASHENVPTTIADEDTGNKSLIKVDCSQSDQNKHLEKECDSPSLTEPSSGETTECTLVEEETGIEKLTNQLQVANKDIKASSSGSEPEICLIEEQIRTADPQEISSDKREEKLIDAGYTEAETVNMEISPNVSNEDSEDNSSTKVDCTEKQSLGKASKESNDDVSTATFEAKSVDQISISAELIENEKNAEGTMVEEVPIEPSQEVADDIKTVASVQERETSSPEERNPIANPQEIKHGHEETKRSDTTSITEETPEDKNVAPTMPQEEAKENLQIQMGSSKLESDKHLENENEKPSSTETPTRYITLVTDEAQVEKLINDSKIATEDIKESASGQDTEAISTEEQILTKDPGEISGEKSEEKAVDSADTKETTLENVETTIPHEGTEVDCSKIEENEHLEKESEKPSSIEDSSGDTTEGGLVKDEAQVVKLNDQLPVATDEIKPCPSAEPAASSIEEQIQIVDPQEILSDKTEETPNNAADIKDETVDAQNVQTAIPHEGTEMDCSQIEENEHLEKESESPSSIEGSSGDTTESSLVKDEAQVGKLNDQLPIATHDIMSCPSAEPETSSIEEQHQTVDPQEISSDKTEETLNDAVGIEDETIGAQNVETTIPHEGTEVNCSQIEGKEHLEKENENPSLIEGFSADTTESSLVKDEAQVGKLNDQLPVSTDDIKPCPSAEPETSSIEEQIPIIDPQEISRDKTEETPSNAAHCKDETVDTQNVETTIPREGTEVDCSQIEEKEHLEKESENPSSIEGSSADSTESSLVKNEAQVGKLNYQLPVATDDIKPCPSEEPETRSIEEQIPIVDPQEISRDKTEETPSDAAHSKDETVDAQDVETTIPHEGTELDYSRIEENEHLEKESENPSSIEDSSVDTTESNLAKDEPQAGKLNDQLPVATDDIKPCPSAEPETGSIEAQIRIVDPQEISSDKTEETPSDATHSKDEIVDAQDVETTIPHEGTELDCSQIKENEHLEKESENPSSIEGSSVDTTESSLAKDEAQAGKLNDQLPVATDDIKPCPSAQPETSSIEEQIRIVDPQEISSDKTEETLNDAAHSKDKIVGSQQDIATSENEEREDNLPAEVNGTENSCSRSTGSADDDASKITHDATCVDQRSIEADSLEGENNTKGTSVKDKELIEALSEVVGDMKTLASDQDKETSSPDEGSLTVDPQELVEEHNEIKASEPDDKNIASTTPQEDVKENLQMECEEHSEQESENPCSTETLPGDTKDYSLQEFTKDINSSASLTERICMEEQVLTTDPQETSSEKIEEVIIDAAASNKEALDIKDIAENVPTKEDEDNLSIKPNESTSDDLSTITNDGKSVDDSSTEAGSFGSEKNTGGTTLLEEVPTEPPQELGEDIKVLVPIQDRETGSPEQQSPNVDPQEVVDNHKENKITDPTNLMEETAEEKNDSTITPQADTNEDSQIQVHCFQTESGEHLENNSEDQSLTETPTATDIESTLVTEEAQMEKLIDCLQVTAEDAKTSASVQVKETSSTDEQVCTKESGENSLEITEERIADRTLEVQDIVTNAPAGDNKDTTITRADGRENPSLEKASTGKNNDDVSSITHDANFVDESSIVTNLCEGEKDTKAVFVKEEASCEPLQVAAEHIEEIKVSASSQDSEISYTDKLIISEDTQEISDNKPEEKAINAVDTVETLVFQDITRDGPKDHEDSLPIKEVGSQKPYVDAEEMDVPENDVQVCLASAHDSDIIQGMQNPEEARLPSLGEKITEKTTEEDNTENEAVVDVDATKSKYIEQLEQDDTTKCFMGDEKSAEIEQVGTECRQEKVMLDEKVDKIIETASTSVDNDIAPESPYETTEKDDFTTERALTIDKEELHTREITPGEYEEPTIDEDKIKEDEASQAQIPNISPATPEMIETTEQDIAKLPSESPKEMCTGRITGDENTSYATTDTREGTGINNNISLEDIHINSRSGGNLQTKTDSEAPEIKEIVSCNLEGQEILSTSRGETSALISPCKTDECEFGSTGNVTAEKKDSNEVGFAHGEKQNEVDSRNQGLESSVKTESCDMITKVEEIKTSEDNLEVAHGKVEAEGRFEPKETACENEPAGVYITREKIKEEEDENVDGYHLVSCMEEVTSHPDDEVKQEEGMQTEKEFEVLKNANETDQVSKDFEEANDKIVAPDKKKSLVNESIDGSLHQEKGEKTIEEFTATLDTEEAHEKDHAYTKAAEVSREKDYEVRTSFKAEDQIIKHHDSPQESHVTDFQVKMAQKDGPMYPQSIGDVNEDMEKSKEGYIEASNKENLVDNPIENIKASVPSDCGHVEITIQEKSILMEEYESKDKPSLSDLLHVPVKETSQMLHHSTIKKESTTCRGELHAEKPDAVEHEEAKTDEEKDDEEHSNEDRKSDLCSEAPVMVESGDADSKVAHKKSHNLLSGVGSKVKHSIAKVKKAITGKSSHPKPPSPK